jgi:hypothetical protein
MITLTSHWFVNDVCYFILVVIMLIWNKSFDLQLNFLGFCFKCKVIFLCRVHWRTNKIHSIVQKNLMLAISHQNVNVRSFKVTVKNTSHFVEQLDTSNDEYRRISNELHWNGSDMPTKWQWQNIGRIIYPNPKR